MKTKLPCLGAGILAAFALLTPSPRASAQAVYNYAMSFRGANDYVRIPDANALDLTNNYTLECFFKADAFGGLRGLVSKYQTPGANGYLLRLAGNHLDFDEMTNASVNLQTGVWYHVAAVNSNSVRRLYLNGQLIPLANTPVAVRANTNPVCLGADYLVENNRFFKGQMDEVRIWNAPRTQAELQTTMNRSLTGTEPNLVAYYRFNEASGIAAYDATPNRLNGTLINRPFRTRSYWWPVVALNSPEPFTNECHVPFVDPTTVNLPVLAIAGGDYYSLGLKADGTVVAWGGYFFPPAPPASGTNAIAIAAGGDHALALRADGTLLRWGSLPTIPVSASNVVAIAAGYHHSLALRADGRVVCWGDAFASSGLLDATNLVAIAAHDWFDLGLRDDGAVVSWGDNYYGQGRIPASATNVVAIAVGSGHCLALKADGTVVGWGNNDYSQASIPAEATNVVAIAAGFGHSLVLKADGTVIGWGDDSFGQIDIPAQATNVATIAARGDQSLAIKADGTLVAWGDNYDGQTAFPADVNHPNLPLRVTGSVNADALGSYPLTYSVTNALGAVGSATRTVVVADRLPPVITLAGNNLLMVRVGQPYVDPGIAALDLCTGDLTGGLVSNLTVNVNIPGIYTNTFTSTDANGNVAVATRTVVVGAPSVTTLPATNVINDQATLRGTVNADGLPTLAWFEWRSGYESNYCNSTAPISVGNGTSAVDLSVPVSGLTPGVRYYYRLVAANNVWTSRGNEQVFWSPFVDLGSPAFITLPQGTPFIDPAIAAGMPLAIAAHGYISLALTDGRVVVWGRTSAGQTNTPADLTNAVAIAAGGEHCLALKPDGRVRAWGSDQWGQCAVPASATNVVAIAAGDIHSVALKADGTVLAWGDAEYGEIAVPPGLSNVVAISAGSIHSLALRANGTIVPWGYNYYGQTNVPPSASNVIAVAAGGEHSLALRADRTVVGWGQNASGQANSPASATNVVAIAAGYYHSLALKADGTVVAWGNHYWGQTNVPPSATNVVAIAAGDFHCLALRADGTIIGWGDNDFGQTTVPARAYQLSLPLVVRGAVNTSVLGTYVLNYGVTNSLGAVGTFTRTVVVAMPPLLTTEPVTAVTPTSAALNGTVNPRASETVAWFEYGLGPHYGSQTIPLPMGNSTNAEGLITRITGLLPWMTYHYRAVGSNALGRVDGPDATFTLPGPSTVVPSLSALPDITLLQGGSTSLWVTVSPPGLEVRVTCNNPVLLPGGSLLLGGSGATRSLSLVPAPSHSGSARVTVSATDGSQTASRSFTLTVTPSSSRSSPLLQLANARRVPPQTFRFQFADAGTASTNYAVEYRSGLFPTNLWSSASNVVVTPLGGGLFQVDALPPPGDAAFYRVKGFQLLLAGLDSTGLTMEEGAAAAGPVLVFNGVYTGTVLCLWTDEHGTTWTNQVQVNGTTAAIPLPASCLNDNARIGQESTLTLQLLPGTGFALGATIGSALTIAENDADWQGVLQAAGCNLDLGLTILQTNGSFRGQIQSERLGFFPTNALAQLNCTADAFTAVATNIPLPTLVASPSLSFTNYVDLRLEATNSPGQTNVSPTRIQGSAILVNRVPNSRHLDAVALGTFMLLKLPTAPSTNHVPLTPAP